MGNSSEIDEMKGVEIAIIGMAGQFPGAPNVEVLWQNLHDGVESVTFFSEEELLAAGIDPVELNSSTYVRAAGVLEDIAAFDASFFGLTPREAEIMDPQHRLFLECAWTALENAGYTADHYPGLIGVYAGAGANSYLFNLYSHRDLLEFVDGLQLEIGNDRDFLTTFVSYKLNLKGPSVSIQTACSTSLVAVHLACQSLLHYECDMALAGGVSLAIPHRVGYLYQEGGINSPDGHCRAFDASARGTVRGSGVGLVVLKRLSDALADGDCIHAVIKGSAINNDGLDKVGYTAPSIQGQAEVIAEALAIARMSPETISYIEAHGTGTALGDPIEVAALTQVFQASTRRTGFCALGSVKTNLGHLDAAAGIAGLLKVVLALKHRQLPPSLHFQQPNSELNLEASPFYINTALRDWVSPTPLRAGISSFGMGGTNAHVVLEEASMVEEAEKSRPWRLLVLSAKTSSALKSVTANLVRYLKQHPNLNIADVSYTLQIGRRAFNHRRAVVCQDLNDAIGTLETGDPARIFTAFVESADRPLAFLFPGLGDHYVDMALELYRTEPSFREQVDLCSELLVPHLGLDLRDVLYPRERNTNEATQEVRRMSPPSFQEPNLREMLYPPRGALDRATEHLNQIWITQPAVFVIEYALAKLLMHWGIYPQAMLGYSIGEYVAACLAGVISIEDALFVVASRARMIHGLTGGTMFAVPLSEKEVQPLLGEDLSLAAINGPSLCVISGSANATAALEHRLTERGVICRYLQISHAFHSKMMEPIVEPFRALLKTIDLKPPKVPYISNVTGTWITTAQAVNPDYWTEHLCQAVRFADGIHELSKVPNRILVEVGPGQTLSTLALHALTSTHPSAQIAVPSLRARYDRQSDVAFLLNTLGKLWLMGVQVDWPEFYAGERYHRIPLPTYPFERQRYWVERQEMHPQPQASPAPLRKKRHLADWCYQPCWKQSLPLATVARWQQAANTTSGRWLVYLDECGLGTKLVERLRSRGQLVVTVQQAEQFSRLGAQAYALNPRRPEDYNKLMAELRTGEQIPQHIMHLWGVTPKQAANQWSDIQEHDHVLDLGFYSLLFLAQALSTQSIIEPLHIGVVSTHMQSVTGDEQLCPAKATLLGLCRVIPQEYPTVTCQSIDLLLPAADESQTLLVEALLGELSQARAETVVAYRGRFRWVQTFEPIHLEQVVPGTGRLRDRGVYLITGGLGSMGLALAEALAQRVQARLVLLGRSAFPQPEQWEAWLRTHGQDDALSQKIQQLRRIEELGGEVLVLQADVTSLEQMQTVLERVQERFGYLHGVIHAAGITRGDAFTTIQHLRRANCEQIFQPKVRGVSVLERVLQGRDIDFCLLQSSLSSILGGLEFAAYSAANIFMDAFAQQCNLNMSVPWISVNWDGWQLREKQEQPLPMGATLAGLSMDPREGMEIVERILSLAQAPQIVVSMADLQARIDQWVKLEAVRSAERAKNARYLSLRSRPTLHNEYVAPRNEIEHIVVNAWQDLLGIGQVGIHDNFFELGGHSLLAIQFIYRLQTTLNIEISLDHLFEAPTAARLAGILSQRQGNQKYRDVPRIQTIRRGNKQLHHLLSEVDQLADSEVLSMLPREGKDYKKTTD